MQELERLVTQHTEQLRTIFTTLRQMNELIGSVNALALSVQELANEQKHMRAELNRMREDVDGIKSRPARRYEGLVDKALLAVVSAAVGWALSHFGL